MGWALQICNRSDISLYSVVLEFLYRCQILIFVCGIQTGIYWTAFVSPKQLLLFNQCCPLQNSLHVTLIASRQFVISIVWTWAHESCSFPQILMVLLNSFPLTTIRGSEKERSHTALNLVSSKGVVFLVTNSCADKAHWTTQAGHRLGSKLMLIHIYFHNALNWPKWNSKHVKNFMDSESSVCETMSSISPNLYLFFAYHWVFWAFQHFLQGSHHFWTWKTTPFWETLSTFWSFHSINTPAERKC